MADKIGTGEYGEILIYQTDNGQTNIEVKIEDDTVWLTQQQLTELYQCSKSNISEHIKHIFEEGELDKDSVVRKFRTTADDGKTYNVTYYNLDMIMARKIPRNGKPRMRSRTSRTLMSIDIIQSRLMCQQMELLFSVI